MKTGRVLRFVYRTISILVVVSMLFTILSYLGQVLGVKAQSIPTNRATTPALTEAEAPTPTPETEPMADQETGLTDCTFSGVINLEGCDDDSGATFVAGGYATTTDASGYYQLSVPEGTYDLSATMAGYLDSDRAGEVCPAGGSKQLPTVTLLGGDTNDDCTIDILDLAFMGSRFGTSSGECGYESAFRSL